MRITNQEWKAFWNDIDPGGNDWYHDDDDVPDNVDELPWFDVTVGTLEFQGSRIPDRHSILTPTELDDERADLMVVFRRWKRKQSTSTLVIEGSADTASQVGDMLKPIGWKVVK